MSDMLTPEQLEAIRERQEEPGKYVCGWYFQDAAALLRHVEALQQERRIHDKCVDDMSAMLDEESDRAEAAQKRAERLEEALREIEEWTWEQGGKYGTCPCCNQHMIHTAGCPAKVARAALEDTNGA